MSDQNNNQKTVINFVWWTLIFSCGIGAFIAISFAFLSIVNGNPFLLIQKTTNAILGNTSTQLTLNEWFAIKQMIQNGKLLTSDQLLNNLSTFYTNVITFLVAFIGFIAFFSYLYIRVQSNEKMDEAIEKKVNIELGHHLNSASHEQMITDKVNTKGRELNALMRSDLDAALIKIDELKAEVLLLKNENQALEETEESDFNEE